MIFLTTTAIDLDEEMLNRCLVLSVNEDRAQTQAIHRVQREAQTLEGLLQRRDRSTILAVHRNAQRLSEARLRCQSLRAGVDLPRLADADPARPHEVSDAHPLYRAVASASAATTRRSSIAGARSSTSKLRWPTSPLPIALAHEVLGRSLDELPPQTRRLLLAVDTMVTAECERQKMARSDYRFSRRDVREATGWGDTQLKIHLHRLEEMEYLLAHRGGRGQSFVYELVFARQADSGKPTLPGLIEIEKLGIDKLKA
jgi:hypothetical protein